MAAPPPPPPSLPPLPSVSPAHLGRADGRRADRDPPWVWTAARWTAGLFLGPIVVLLVTVAVLTVLEVTDDGNLNDDGSGAVAFLAVWAFVLLLPVLALGVLMVVCAAVRSRASLWLHAIVGSIGTLLSLSAIGSNSMSFVTLVLFGTMTSIAVRSIVVVLRA